MDIMGGITKFFNALFELIEGILLGRGKFEEIGIFEMVEEFLYKGIFSQFRD